MTKTPKPAPKVTHPAMKPELWPLEKIRPYPNNPRTHPPAQVALLCALMQKRGIDQPIVVDDKGFVLKGHGRLMAAQLGKFATFPVIQRLGLTDAEKVAIRIEDNSVPMLAGWDRELIAGEIAILKHFNYDLNLLGFGEAQLVHFTTQPGPPASFPAVGDDIKTEHECPKCGYRWSGSSAKKEPPPEKSVKSRQKSSKSARAAK